MESPGDNAYPSRRAHKPLPRCLTRLLEPARLDGGYVADPAVQTSAENGMRSYPRVLAAIWLDLDRLAQLTPQPSRRTA
jgi:hypothetical protein